MEKTKQKVAEAGAIIVNDNKEILLEYRARSINDWTFPKGHVDPGESPEETTIREVKEETGYDIEIIRGLPDITYKYGDIQVNQKMFLAKVTSGTMRKEYIDDKLLWLPIDKINEKLSHNNLKDLFSSIKDSL